MVAEQTRTRRAARKAPLSQAILVDGAIALAEAEGLAAVTIRRIAQQHGVTATALYAHFRDKDDLLDAMAEHLLGEVVLPELTAGEWSDNLEAVLHTVVGVLRRYPETTSLIRRRVLSCDAGLHLTERILTLLAEGGYDTEQTAMMSRHILNTLIALIISEPGRRYGQDEEAHAQAIRTRQAQLAALPPRHYPHVIAAARALVSCANPDDHYARGVDLLIRGARALGPPR